MWLPYYYDCGIKISQFMIYMFYLVEVILPLIIELESASLVPADPIFELDMVEL